MSDINSSVSSGDLIPDSTDDSILETISFQLDELRDYIVSDPALLNSSLVETFDSDIDGYKVISGGENIYIPFDRVSYLTRLPDGQLFNLSSSSITCYGLDNYGNHGRTYRFPSFGTLQRYDYSGGSYYWTNVSISDDNITTGQLGLHSFDQVILFSILFVLCLMLFVRRR